MGLCSWKPLIFLINFQFSKDVTSYSDVKQNADIYVVLTDCKEKNGKTLSDGGTGRSKYYTDREKRGKHEAMTTLSIPSSRSRGIISFTASKIPLCLASWPSSSLAHALQQPHTEQPDSPEPQPQILVGGKTHRHKLKNTHLQIHI